MNSDKVCVYENEQSNVYEKINKQNTETAEYDTLNVVKTGNKNDHWISPRVLVCALAVNVVVIISLLILGTAVIMELSNEGVRYYLYICFIIILTLYHAEFLKWNNQHSIYGTFHHHF